MHHLRFNFVKHFLGMGSLSPLSDRHSHSAQAPLATRLTTCQKILPLAHFYDTSDLKDLFKIFYYLTRALLHTKRALQKLALSKKRVSSIAQNSNLITSKT